MAKLAYLSSGLESYLTRIGLLFEFSVFWFVGLFFIILPDLSSHRVTVGSQSRGEDNDSKWCQMWEKFMCIMKRNERCFYVECFLVFAEIEDMIGHTDTKIISDINLAFLVRQMAVHANVSILHFTNSIISSCFLVC